jgi:hypothetical protein
MNIRILFFTLLLFSACIRAPEEDPLMSLYLSVSEDASGEGLQKTYLLDTAALKVDLHWPNPETAKEQHLTRVDSFSTTVIRPFLGQMDSLLHLLEAPWALPLDTILSCSGCGDPQLYYRIQTKSLKIFRLQMPEDYPRQNLPEALRLQLELFEAWLKSAEAKEPRLE